MQQPKKAKSLPWKLLPEAGLDEELVKRENRRSLKANVMHSRDRCQSPYCMMP